MTWGTITAEALHRGLAEGAELALLDVREQGVFGQGHILLANNLPLSRLELALRDLVPRRSVPVVLCDGGEGLAERAAAVLAAAGYGDVSLLEGGVAAWEAAGYEVYSGVNVPSKAFGEFVEQRYGTPSISAEQLKAKLDAGDDVLVLDSRPMSEFRVMNIPGGIDTPGAELVYRVRDLTPNSETLVVVNCAGRTRSIIGCQSLINAGLPNPVVALRNGTMGWHLAGFELEHEADRSCGGVSGHSAVWAHEAARRVAERFGVRRVEPAELDAWRAEAEQRTLYIFDVRGLQEYAAAHLPDARHAPGGQLVQATDRWIAVRGARVVLVDDTEVRALMTASWLVQMGLPEVYVLNRGIQGHELERGVAAPEVPELAAAQVELVEPAALHAGGDETIVVDVGGSLAHRSGHIPGAWWAIRARLGEALDRLAGAGRVVVTSEDGRLARLAAADLQAELSVPVVALAGGTQAWSKAGLPLDKGIQRAFHPESDIYHRPYDRTAGIEAAIQAYLDWEVALVEQVARDGTLEFPEFPR